MQLKRNVQISAQSLSLIFTSSLFVKAVQRSATTIRSCNQRIKNCDKFATVYILQGVSETRNNYINRGATFSISKRK